MKFVLLAAVAATLSLPVAPMMAKTAPGLTLPTLDGTTSVDRRSGRCPGGELRFFVVGCSGV